METTAGLGSDNVLDFALNAFSAQNEEELYKLVQKATVKQIGLVLEQYRSWAAEGIIRAPNLTNGELRPYFVTSSRLAAWARGGLDSLDGFKDQAAIWTAVDSIKHRLLYCHSLAIDDAMGSLLYRNAIATSDDSRERLLNYVNFLLHMAPLLRQGILCPITSYIYLRDRERTARSGWTQVRDRLTTELKNSTFLTDLSIGEFWKVAPEEIKRSWETELQNSSSKALVQRAMFYNSCERVGRALSATAYAQEKLTTYLPFRYDVKVLCAFQRSVFSKAKARPLGCNLPYDYENWLVNQLIDVELPNLGELTPDELVSIRLNSQEFENWRKTLADAIQQADNAVPKDIWGRDTAVRNEIASKLEEGRVRLEESLPKAARRKGAKSAGVAMTAGLIAAGFSLLINPAMTMTAVLASLVAPLASAAVLGGAEALEGKSNKARQAALAHYVAVLR